MAGTPRWKIYDQDRNYVAATIDATLAAAVVGSAGGDGWAVKIDGRIVWREGQEQASAGDSYDDAAELMYARQLSNAQDRRTGTGTVL
jgi:hypothetical protein